jgi:hypothetical protein
MNARGGGGAFAGRIFIPTSQLGKTTKLIIKDLVLDGVKNKCRVGGLRIPPRSKLDLRSFGISRSVEW